MDKQYQDCMSICTVRMRRRKQHGYVALTFGSLERESHQIKATKIDHQASFLAN